VLQVAAHSTSSLLAHKRRPFVIPAKLQQPTCMSPRSRSRLEMCAQELLSESEPSQSNVGMPNGRKKVPLAFLLCCSGCCICLAALSLDRKIKCTVMTTATLHPAVQNLDWRLLCSRLITLKRRCSGDLLGIFREKACTHGEHFGLGGLPLSQGCAGFW
jgi:hypothetical protein